MNSKVEFTFTAQSLTSDRQRLDYVPLNIMDTTTAYCFSFYTPVNVVYDDGSPGEGLYYTYNIAREGDNDDLGNLARVAFTCEKGGVGYYLTMQSPVLTPGQTYDFTAIYRDGIFARTQFPRVVIEVLPDADLTRKCTIYY